MITRLTPGLLVLGLLPACAPAARPPEQVPVLAPAPERPLVLDYVLGAWDWASGDATCRGNQHRISVSDDGREMLLTFEEPLDSTMSGRFVSYRVVAAGEGIHDRLGFVIRAEMEGETRTTETGEPVVWDLIMATPNRYHWHRTDWPDLGVTGAIIRCDGNRPLEEWRTEEAPAAATSDADDATR